MCCEESGIQELVQKAPREVIWSNLCTSRYDVLLRKWQMRIRAEGTALSVLGLSTFCVSFCLGSG